LIGKENGRLPGETYFLNRENGPTGEKVLFTGKYYCLVNHNCGVRHAKDFVRRLNHDLGHEKDVFLTTKHTKDTKI
jgi:hypothetical protein